MYGNLQPTRHWLMNAPDRETGRQLEQRHIDCALCDGSRGPAERSRPGSVGVGQQWLPRRDPGCSRRGGVPAHRRHPPPPHVDLASGCATCPNCAPEETLHCLAKAAKTGLPLPPLPPPEVSVGLAVVVSCMTPASRPLLQELWLPCCHLCPVCCVPTRILCREQ